MRPNKCIITIIVFLILFVPQTVEAKSGDITAPQISEQGSSFTTLVNNSLECILMDNWEMIKTNDYEYIIKKNINGEQKEIGGIEVLAKDRSNTASKMFRNLKESGGSYILIEDKLLEKWNHTQYHIKWIKDKKYYVDVYIMHPGPVSYHVSLCADLRDFENLYQQFENFIATLDVRDSIIADHLNGYYNNVDKYMIYLPEGWKVENDKEFAGTFFQKKETGKLSIYKQPLDGVSANTYIWYSNKMLFQGVGEFQLIYKRDVEEKGKRLVEYMWRRPSISTLDDDYNYYWETNIINDGEKYVYTYIMKTNRKGMDQAFKDYQTILSSFRSLDYGIRMFPPVTSIQSRDYEVHIAGKEKELLIPEGKTLLGIFSEHVPGDYLDVLKEVENELGYKFEFVMSYYTLDTEYPEEEIRKIYDDGRIMMLTLHPWELGNLTDLIIPRIVEGEYDRHITEWANKIKELGEPVFIRFANEMNGDWDPWCAWFTGKDHDLYIEAWKRVYTLFKEAGAQNAYFVWNPHDRSYPDFKWNNPHLYYPGDEYVDWIGLTGYNNGASHEWDKWREFDQIYDVIYNEYRKLYPGKPLMITEFASSETGGNKAQWILDAYRYLRNKYTGIKIVVWFNQVDGRWEYPITSSPEARNAFMQAIKADRYQFNAIR